jgi:serine/threonine protein kinase
MGRSGRERRAPLAVEPRRKVKETSPHTVSDVGRYRLIAELARGGMGVVYLALVRGPGGFNKLFVVKELKAHLAEDASLVSLFLEEARISAKLSHPNVVQTIEVGSDGDRHYIAMEFLDGQALNRLLNRTERAEAAVPLHFHMQILSGMLQGLEYVHDLADFDGRPFGLVHRDVSPHNVFVTYDGQVKLLDFGIAKVLDSSHQTNTGVLKGKIAYMSPEQAGGLPVDRRTDVFAAGVMLFEAVTGKRMWAALPNDLQILRALTSGEIPKVREARPDVDDVLARIVERATAFDRTVRYATAAEFQVDLDAYQRTLRVERFDPRAIGKFVGELFADERRNIKAIIDEQLRVVRGTAGVDPTAIELPRLSPYSGANGTPSATAALDPLTAGNSESRERAIRAQTASGVVTGGGTAPRGRWWKSRALPAVVVVAAMSSIGTVALRSPRQSVGAGAPPPSRVAVSPVPAATGARVPETAAAPAPIQAQITAFPATATISVDDGPPRIGPFAATFVRDGASHTVLIEAPNYESKTLTFAADADRTFDIGLEPRHGATVPRSSHGARVATTPPASTTSASSPGAAIVSAAPAPPSPPAASAAERNRQQIDTKDPYAR